MKVLPSGRDKATVVIKHEPCGIESVIVNMMNIVRVRHAVETKKMIINKHGDHEGPSFRP
jgi:hypothetical protein